jgi:hypothetical protein
VQEETGEQLSKGMSASHAGSGLPFASLSGFSVGIGEDLARELALAARKKDSVNCCIKFMPQRVGHKSATNIHEQVIKDSDAAKTSRAAVIDTR